jgi:hypothetical protein
MAKHGVAEGPARCRHQTRDVRWLGRNDAGRRHPKAIEVHIFPESMRGTGEGHYDWDLKPQSKMTNGNVKQTVAGVEGPILSVKYKDGEKKLLVTPDTVVVTYVMGSNCDFRLLAASMPALFCRSEIAQC